ncbi:SET domain - like 10 [Theobroma cacao]|nr:SET domain - like 10 [Theobroma cacao]
MEQLQASLQARGLSVSNLPDKGRSLVTTKDFYPGEVIISQEPYVFVPNNSLTESSCDGCFSKSNLKKCSACQVVWYCGSTCQLVLYAQMANLVNLILGCPDIDIKEIAENFSKEECKLMLKPEAYLKQFAERSKIACNAHTICDSELRPLGTGLYPVISIINHSCLPNSVLVFEGRLAVVRAVQHIPKDAEILISYIETATSTITRQKTLKEQYLFTCTCPCCIKVGQHDDIQESAILEGYRCRDNRCSGFLLRESDDKGFVCQQCGLTRNKEEIRKKSRDIKALLDKAPNSDPQDAMILYKNIEKLQKEVCHPFSISLMRTWEKLHEVLVQLEEWKEALTFCRLTIPVYERVYPGFHPLLGLQYYSCGKLELLGETDDAIKSLTKAVDILRITHGTNTPFMKELLMKLEEARAEASYTLSCKE